MWKFKLVHYPRFKRRCSDRDGNTRSKSKAGRSGQGSCTDCRTVLYASPNHKFENFNERYPLFSTAWIVPPSQSSKGGSPNRVCGPLREFPVYCSTLSALVPSSTKPT